MTLTPAGRVFLDRTVKALDSLRSGHRDLNALDLTELSALSLGVIEDFENEVTPTLTARLAEGMSQCAFGCRRDRAMNWRPHRRTRPRHRDLRRPDNRPAGTRCRICWCATPISSPFRAARSLDHGLAGLSHLSFLRRDMDQLMGQQIEAYLVRDEPQPAAPVRDGLQPVDQRAGRLGHGLDDHDPLSLLRAGRFAGGIDAHPLARRAHRTADRAVRDR
jgi:DNA-binding transcriptional LysR family regulator